jgi:hypothetical protein
MAWSDRSWYYDGSGRRFRCNKGLYYYMKSLNAFLRSRRYGSEREPMNWYQGSYSTRVGASGSTHAGGGVYDRTPYNKTKRNKAERLWGGISWNRTPRQGPWVAHGHCVLNGDGTASASAKQQVVNCIRYNDNGLRGNAKDDGYRPRRWAMYVSPEKAAGKWGKRRATVACHEYDEHSPLSDNLGPIAVGEIRNVVGVVAVKNGDGEKEYWGGTSVGTWIFLGNFELA